MAITALESDVLWSNGRLATFDPRWQTSYGEIAGGLVVRGDRLSAVAPMDQFDLASFGDRVVDVAGRWITPGLVDCHSHLVYAGNRAQEWQTRLAGGSYVDIAKAGGGILQTVRATREARVEQLVRLAEPRLQALAAEGVTCVEIKSGYGLTVDDELKMLAAAASLASAVPVEIVPTLLAAHAIPPEFMGRANDYVELIVERMIPKVADLGLAQAVDVFCEGIAFTPDQAERIWRAALERGLPIKGHVEQLSNFGGARRLAALGALSADHLEYLDDAGVKAMADANVVAVLLPAAFYFLREKQAPPVAALRKASVRMAIGTDLNPGTAPFASLRLAMNMACVLFGLSPEEALAGATREAAAALGRQDSLGTLSPGKFADFLVWDIEHPMEIIGRLGMPLVAARVFRGRLANVTPPVAWS